MHHTAVGLFLCHSGMAKGKQGNKKGKLGCYDEGLLMKKKKKKKDHTNTVMQKTIAHHQPNGELFVISCNRHHAQINQLNMILLLLH